MPNAYLLCKHEKTCPIYYVIYDLNSEHIRHGLWFLLNRGDTGIVSNNSFTYIIKYNYVVWHNIVLFKLNFTNLYLKSLFLIIYFKIILSRIKNKAFKMCLSQHKMLWCIIINRKFVFWDYTYCYADM